MLQTLNSLFPRDVKANFQSWSHLLTSNYNKAILGLSQRNHSFSRRSEWQNRSLVMLSLTTCKESARRSAGLFRKQWSKNLMTKPDKENWICNIQDYADRVAEQLGWETVRFVLNEYGGGASSIETLSPSNYEAVWNALFDYEVGMRD